MISPLLMLALDRDVCPSSVTGPVAPLSTYTFLWLEVLYPKTSHFKETDNQKEREGKGEERGRRGDENKEGEEDTSSDDALGKGSSTFP